MVKTLSSVPAIFVRNLETAHFIVKLLEHIASKVEPVCTPLKLFELRRVPEVRDLDLK